MSHIAVCTLIEGAYHLGLAALINSLHFSGFKGDVYIGYRGSLPSWVSGLHLGSTSNVNDAQTVRLVAGIKMTFLKKQFDVHFTNYKPVFALELLQHCSPEISGMLYFDPDIVVKANWQFFEHWLSCGVAVVHEAVQQSLPDSHPLRHHWRHAIGKACLEVKRTMNAYCNAGFFGVRREDMQFLKNWVAILDVAEQHYQMDARLLQQDGLDRTYPFFSCDQDAMNAALMTIDNPVSEVGPDGMDLIPAGWIMSHATGGPKPWNKHFIKSILLRGVPPKSSDRYFWHFANAPIQVFSPFHIKRKKTAIKLASIIGRGFRRY